MSTPDAGASRSVAAPSGQKTGVGDPPPPPKSIVICQNLTSGVSFYADQYKWATEWQKAQTDRRAMFPVRSEAATTPDGSMDAKKIKALGDRLLKDYDAPLRAAKGDVVYWAVSHGGTTLDLNDPEVARTFAQAKADLEATETANAAQKKQLEEYKSNGGYRKEDVDKFEQDYLLNVERAKITRAQLYPAGGHFSTFSLGAQQGGLHSQLLAMDFHYFLFKKDQEKTNAWPPSEVPAFKARGDFFAAMKEKFVKYGVKRLHLIACNIGKDAPFIRSVAKELGVEVLAYPQYVGILRANGRITLSETKTVPESAYTSVEPPMSPSTVSRP